MSSPVFLVSRAEPAPASCPLPLLSSTVRAGFPSLANDHLDNGLDLHQHVVDASLDKLFESALLQRQLLKANQQLVEWLEALNVRSATG